MTRYLSLNLKKAIACICAVMIFAGAVPLLFPNASFTVYAQNETLLSGNIVFGYDGFTCDQEVYSNYTLFDDLYERPVIIRAGSTISVEQQDSYNYSTTADVHLYDSVLGDYKAVGSYQYNSNSSYTLVSDCEVTYFYSSSPSGDEPHYITINLKEVTLTAAVTAPPQAISGLSYNGGDQALVYEGTAEHGTMQYSAGRIISGNYIWLKASDLAVGDILKPPANAANGIYLPKGAKLKIGEKTIGGSNIQIELFANAYRIVVGAYNADASIQEYNAVRITDYDSSTDTYTGAFVKAEAPEAGSWAESVPTAKAAGEYTVFYRAVGDSVYANSEISSVKVSIAKTPATVAPAPRANNTTGCDYIRWNGEANNLVTEGVATNGTLKYALGRMVERGSDDPFNDIAVYDIFKPWKNSQIYLPTGANLKLGDTIYTGGQENVKICRDKEYQLLLCIVGSNAQYQATDALKDAVRITAYDAETNTYTAQIIQSENAMRWSETIPTGTEQGRYSVSYKAFGTGGYSDSATVWVPVTIATEPTVKGTSLTMDGEIGVNVYINAPKSFENGAYAMVKGPNDAEAQKVFFSSDIKTNDGYKFTATAYSVQMYENVTVEVYDAYDTKLKMVCGDETVSTYTTSVGRYIDSAKENPNSSEKLINFVKAIDAYGAYAEKFFKGTAATEARTSGVDLDSITSETVKVHEISKTGKEPENFSFYGISLTLEEKTSLKLYFKYTGEAAAMPAVTLNGESITSEQVGESDYWYVTIPKIASVDLDDTHTVVFGGTYTVNVSALSYAYSALNNPDSDADLVNVCKALVKYNQEAITYFNSRNNA